jgi:hypothetical protein
MRCVPSYTVLMVDSTPFKQDLKRLKEDGDDSWL